VLTFRGGWSWLVVAMVVATASASAGDKPARALWAWNSASILENASSRLRFVDFCVEKGVDMAWLQVTRRVPGEPRLEHAEEWRELLEVAHARGVRIHALDGDPENVLPGRHDSVLALVDTIIRFNRDAAINQRFDGIHLDNEPYLLPGWRDPIERERLLASYLALNAAVQRAVRAAGGLAFGVDIPFWWQYRDDRTGRPIADVEYGGVRKAASFHILDIVDNVAVMDYRNAAGGDDGLIAHARGLLDYANGTGARVFVGVETSPAERLEHPKLTFDGRSNDQMERELAAAQATFANHQSYAGFAIQNYVSYFARFARTD
jgi:hypothetical protein